MSGFGFFGDLVQRVASLRLGRHEIVNTQRIVRTDGVKLSEVIPLDDAVGVL